jgi:transketolase
MNVNLLYFHTFKPLDAEVLARYSKTKMLVIHDAFGLFESVCATVDSKVKYHGIPDKFCCYYGTLEDIRRLLMLDAAGIKNIIQKELSGIK